MIAKSPPGSGQSVSLLFAGSDENSITPFLPLFSSAESQRTAVSGRLNQPRTIPDAGVSEPRPFNRRECRFTAGERRGDAGTTTPS